jgi:hypothetical protein
MQDRRHGCNGKRAYPSFAEAERVAKRVRAHTDDPVQAYRCRFCGLFHNGQSKRIEPQARHRRRKAMAEAL